MIRGSDVVATYSQLAQDTSALATALSHDHKLAPGERVAMLMTNATDYVTALFAAWWAGLVVVPINAKLNASEIEFILGNSGARVFFISSDLVSTASHACKGASQTRIVEVGGADWRQGLRAEGMARPFTSGPDDLAWIFYTSGTTGRPKGAMLSIMNLRTMAACYSLDVQEIGCEDAVLHAAPMSHGSGMYILPHIAAAAPQIVPESGGFDVDEIAALCRTHASVSFFAAPTMVRRLVNGRRTDAGDMPGLRTIVYGGGPMYVEDCLEAIQRLGPRLAQIYGQGESPMTITAMNRAAHRDDGSPRWRERLGSVGTAQSLVSVRIADEAGKDIPPGEIGEVLVRGPSVMAGYWRWPDATAEALRGGWLRTGDLGSMDDDGFLTLRDRSKDVVISGGSNIYPREVEETLLTHPSVAEVSVVGMPDREWGEIVVAFVVAREADRPPAEAELDAHCLTHIARFKRPKIYRLVPELPKNATGKVLKTTLRTWLTPK